MIYVGTSFDVSARGLENKKKKEDKISLEFALRRSVGLAKKKKKTGKRNSF